MEELRRASVESGHSLVKLALGWVLDRDDVTSVLIGARRAEHVDQALEAEQWAVDDTSRQWLARLGSPPR